jgi:hypothetical protein
MALALNPFIPSDGVITISDGGVLVYTLGYDDGDYSVGPLMYNQRQALVFKKRGTTYAVREGEDTEIEISFSAHAHTILGDGTTAGLYDVVRRTGVWATATSTLPASAGGGANGKFCHQVKWAGERTNFGATADSGITLKYVHLESTFQEGVPGKFSFKCRAFCYSTDYLTVV